MNKVILMGRLTKDPDVRYTQGNDPLCVSRYTLAVDRRKQQDGTQQTDFISCVAFGKAGKFAGLYLKKGSKVAIVGRIQTGSYTNRDGIKVYTTDVLVEEHEFAESKKESAPDPRQEEPQEAIPEQTAPSDFVSVPDGYQEQLPFI